MLKKSLVMASLLFAVIFFQFCTKGEESTAIVDAYPAIEAAFGAKINPTILANYANQGRPAYITKDNAGANMIVDSKATLGRVLFYDKNLSIDNSISCASCHKQAFAFG